MTLAKFIQTGAAAVCALAVATQVNAADIYAGSGLKDGPLYASAQTWAGFYLGANVGGAWGDLTSTDVNVFDATVTAGGKWTNSTTGIAGGGQAGYNFQYGNVVFGPEIDFGGLGLSHSQDETPAVASHFSRLGDGFAFDATGRLGYAMGPTLSYIKGGYAYYDGQISYNTGVAATTKSVSGVDGYTIGSGFEYRISPSWSVKSEYQYFDFSADLHPRRHLQSRTT